MASLEQRWVKGLARLWTVQDLAQWLTVHPRTVRKWIGQGRVPAPIRVGTFVRWDPITLKRWERRLTKAQP